MEKIRGFEIAKGWENKDINLPQRSTKHAAGYDFEARETVTIKAFKPGMEPTLVKTGIKAYMLDDEMLCLYNRSSNPKKKGLILANSVGIVDKDYYGNESNDGNIMFAFWNFKEEDVIIEKGERIIQESQKTKGLKRLVSEKKRKEQMWLILMGLHNLPRIYLDGEGEIDDLKKWLISQEEAFAYSSSYLTALIESEIKKNL